ncbi:MAG: asparagine synthase-related protein [Candidatus Hadarchaeum sp.]|uniref:asparagine synthase-related protein n=1 Tax=Candidatus Hadarchaeum sp. TaxID=2883567 RepID=UPI00316BCAF6
MCNLHVKLGPCWHYTDGVSVKGAGFVQERLHTKDALAHVFSHADNWENFVQILKTINGFFAVVVHREDRCYAAVDRTRSIPLFYAVHENTVFLSDSPEWIQNQIGERIVDSVSLIEFLLTGYVTGFYTLDPRIHQLQAGEALAVTVAGGEISCHTERYYRFLTGKDEPRTLSEEELLSRLDKVTVEAIERLVIYASGRPIVVPLSGGLDSRLIAINLKRLGYGNVIAFSYGVKGNWESKTSESIARQLDLPWHFVEYSPNLWKQWYWSEECRSYLRYASRLVSLAHLQDWPAVMELTKKRIIPSSSVIVPGHTGDFVTGGHIPIELQMRQIYSTKDVLEAILRHHYNLMPIETAAEHAKVNPDDIRVRLLQRLWSCFEFSGEKAVNAPEAVRLYEYWDWQERQAKYIVNSVRVYDFYGLDWWLPWWDKELMEFWTLAPLEFRIDQQLYKNYVKLTQTRWNIKIREPLSLRAKRFIRKADQTDVIKMLHSALSKYRTPACRILALHAAFDLKSERHMSVLGAAALAQLGFSFQEF